MIKRAKTFVNGIVQGVGFRPFIHKLITDYDIKGWVRNSSVGAEMELEGEEEDIRLFLHELKNNPPKLALITSIDVEYMTETAGYSDFKIIQSKTEKQTSTLVSPDVCICDECLAEMKMPGRRYRYPFINCTNCGPRFTIIKELPYDRAKTTMAPFKMCPECHREYTDINDRRYHAEPTGCNICGPKQFFCDCDGNELSGDPIELTKQYLRDGLIVAIKGLGGFHLAGRIDDPSIADTLRRRKHRDEKPFAIMCRDVETVKKLCMVSADEERILCSRQRPIVLLKKLRYDLLPSVSENGYIGVMLPYTPVHYMIFEDDIEALIMTSANISDLPIIYKNEEAINALSGIADGFLLSNRDIHMRCDDSVVYVYDSKVYPLRRSRGYSPYPILMKDALPALLACGAEQKASFCLSKGNFAIPSQHIGDLKNVETFENYKKSIAHFRGLYDIKPEKIACDLHPDFLSTAYADSLAKELDIPLIRVQHHHAHLASCMADNNLDEKVIGIIWDGTGYGTDGNIWGGEFLLGDFSGFERLAHLDYMKLPGGDLAVKDIRRMGISLLEKCGLDAEAVFKSPDTGLIREQLLKNINCPLSSGMGRLFDGISAILGIKEKADYEGQGAILLEAAATASERRLGYEISDSGAMILNMDKTIMSIYKEITEGSPDVGELCAAFLNTLVSAAADIAKRISDRYGIKKVVLSGGTFNNMYIMNRLPDRLESLGLTCYHHSRVSAGDEGLCLGQLMICSRS